MLRLTVDRIMNGLWDHLLASVQLCLLRGVGQEPG